MSGMLTEPVLKTIAFVGVAMGRQNANEADNVTAKSI